MNEYKIGFDFERNMDEKERHDTGAIYTLEKITIENSEYTICKYLSNGKAENTKEVIKLYKENPKKLINKLNNLKIIDPACGTGNFLIGIIKVLQNLYKKAYGKNYDEVRIKQQIINNNIYGVDLNPKAIQIAQKIIPTKNLKIGNSLLSKEFNWEKEFPEVFEQGGFDIVIGNPPYVRHETEDVKKIKPELKKEYKCYHGQADLSAYFFEKALKLLKENGIMSYICTKSYERAGYGIKLRTQILENNILKYVDHNGEKLFNASVNTSSIFIQKTFDKNNEINVNNKYNLKQEYIDATAFNFDKKTVELRAKITNKGTPIKELDIKIQGGIKTGCNDAFYIDKETRNELISKDNRNKKIIVPLLRGRDIKRYEINFNNIYMINSHKTLNLEEEYPTVYEYLKQFEERLSNRNSKGNNWYNMPGISKKEHYSKPRLIYPNMSKDIRPYYDTSGTYIDQKAYSLTSESIDLKTLAGLIGSKVANFYNKQIGNGLDITKKTFEQIPLIIPENNIIADKVDKIMTLKENNKELKESFNKWFEIEFNKTVTFDETIETKDFLKNNHVNGRKKQLEVTKEYNKVKEEITNNNNNITQLENEIDEIVYKLYDLTKEEIAIIENNY